MADAGGAARGKGALAALLVAFGAVVVAIVLRTEDSLAGDPYAVYLPAADAFRALRFWEGARQHLAGLAWGRAPGFALAIAAVGRATGLDSFRAAQLLSAVSSLVTLWLVYRLALLFADRASSLVAIAAVVIVGGTPAWLGAAAEPMSDALAVALNLGLVLLLLRAEVLGAREVALGVLLAALAGIVRPTSTYFSAWVLVALLLRVWRGWRSTAAALALAVAPHWPLLSRWRAYYAAYLAPPDAVAVAGTPRAVFNRAVVPLDGPPIDGLADLLPYWRDYAAHVFGTAFDAAAVRVVGLLLAAAAVFGLVVFLSRRDAKRWALVLYFAAYYLAMALILSEPRYHLHTLPILAIGAAWLLLVIVEASGHRRVVAAMIGALLAARAASSASEAIARAAEVRDAWAPMRAAAAEVGAACEAAPGAKVGAHWAAVAYAPAVWRAKQRCSAVLPDAKDGGAHRFYLFLDAWDGPWDDPLSADAPRCVALSREHSALVLERIAPRRLLPITVTGTGGASLGPIDDRRLGTSRGFPGRSLVLDVRAATATVAELRVLPGPEARARRWTVDDGGGPREIVLPSPCSAIALTPAKLPARLTLTPASGPLSIAEVVAIGP